MVFAGLYRALASRSTGFVFSLLVFTVVEFIKKRKKYHKGDDLTIDDSSPSPYRYSRVSSST